jgi:hypothetical protein
MERVLPMQQGYLKVNYINNFLKVFMRDGKVWWKSLLSIQPGQLIDLNNL